MKYPSRNRKKNVEEITDIVCPYCKHKYQMDKETEDDYYIYLHTKIHYCRGCGEEFINGITKDILFRYN